MAMNVQPIPSLSDRMNQVRISTAAIAMDVRKHDGDGLGWDFGS